MILCAECRIEGSADAHFGYRFRSSAAISANPRRSACSSAVASLARFLLRHPGEDRTPWIIALSVALAALYLLGPALGSRPTPRRLARLGVLVAVWMVLVVLAPSFAWCAVPLFYTGLRLLPPRAAFALVALLPCSSWPRSCG